MQSSVANTMNPPAASLTFRALTRNRNARLRLFCFPHAAAGATAYFAWAKQFSIESEIIGVQLPGRENRISEPPLRTLDAILSLLMKEIRPMLDRPFVFFGHSMGALVAFRLSHCLRRQGWPEPAHLFVSGRASPNLPIQALHELPTQELLQHVRSFDGTAAEVLQSDEMLSLVLPLLRADCCWTGSRKPSHRSACTFFVGHTSLS
jgi:medium-chain acyl-[acyl-carrier-protein] hydrolase